MDSRAVLGIDMGFHITTMLRPLLKPDMGSMSFWSTKNIDCSSCEVMQDFYQQCHVGLHGIRPQSLGGLFLGVRAGKDAISLVILLVQISH